METSASRGSLAGVPLGAVRTAGWLAVALLVAAALAGPAAPIVEGQNHSPGGPPGNNGTVKVDGEPFDTHPDNEPHVGCTFQIDWYGFDANVRSDVTFESQPPTGPVRVLLQDSVTLDGDDNSGGGSEAGLDAQRTYTLSFDGIEPHPNQGYHVKLTINTEGSQGADVKHKVFWVQGCVTTTTTTTTATTTTGTTTTGTTTTGTTTTGTTTTGTTTTGTTTTGTTTTATTTTTTTTTITPVVVVTTTTTTPTGGVLPTQGTPPPPPTSVAGPTGTVLGATGVPSLPPTDAGDAPARTGDTGWRTALLVLAAILGLVLAAAPRPVARKVRSRH